MADELVIYLMKPSVLQKKTISPQKTSRGLSKVDMLKRHLAATNADNRASVITMDLTDICMGEERLHRSVIHKASSISHLVSGTTIGPKSNENTPSSSSVGTQSAAQPKKLKSHPARVETAQFKNNTAGVIEKLLYELEQERQDKVRETIRRRMESLEHQAREREREVREKQANVKCEAKDRADVELEQAQRMQQEREFQERQRQASLALAQQKRLHERMQLVKKNHLLKIKQFENTFQISFQQLLECISACRDKEELQVCCAASLQTVKTLNEATQQLVQRCSVGELSATDIQTADSLLHQLDNCHKNIQDSVVTINARCEEHCAREQALLQQAAEVPAEDTISVSVIPESIFAVPEEAPAPAESDALHMYTHLRQYLAEFQASLTTLTQDRRYKEFMFNCRKAVNIPVNAICDISATHLHDKLKRLTYLLLGETVVLEGVRFSAKSHPQGVAYCMDLLASKLVSQGKASVSSKPESAFPVAAITVALWAEFPELGKLLVAHFHRACPYLVPVYLPQVQGQTNEDYLKMLGYKYDDSGNVEKQDQFLKKMSGIMRLYSAIMITPVRQQQRQPHPHGIAQAWHWIASMLNLEPSKDITATLLLDFLEVTGSAMAGTYGIQFQKVLHLMCKDYFHRIQKIDDRSGPTSRLEVFLQTTLKRGGIPRPQGMLPANFW